MTDEMWTVASATFRTEFYRNGDEICAKGDPAEALFIIWRGQVNISANGTHLLTRCEHEIIGEQAGVLLLRGSAWFLRLAGTVHGPLVWTATGTIE